LGGVFLLKLILTLASLAVIYKSVMETGDPMNLFSNLLVLYAMYFVSYNENSDKLKVGFLKFTKVTVFIIGFTCFLGWIGIFTIKDIGGQYFIAVSENMRLDNLALLNVHAFFFILAGKLSLISGLEWTVGLNDRDKADNDNQVKKTKGA
jgi:hypothetical protein